MSAELHVERAAARYGVTPERYEAATDAAFDEVVARRGWPGWPGSPARSRWVRDHGRELRAATERHLTSDRPSLFQETP